MKSFRLKSKNGSVGIGVDYPIRVNCNVGINNNAEAEFERAKIATIFNKAETTPDLMMDLSTIRSSTAIFQLIIDSYGIPVGTLPVYTIFNRVYGITKAELIDELCSQAEKGVSFFTLHFTADYDLYERAIKTRKIPITSRGGGLVLTDLIKNKRQENILLSSISDIISIAKEYGVAISLGTTFRPAGIVDACDEVHIAETYRQRELCQYLQESGVNVIVENIGHIDVVNIDRHAALLREFKAPIMPLGPIPTDNAVGYDHISASIGSAFAGYFGCAHIINAITPSEHATSDISTDDAIAGIIAAKIAAHSINILRFPEKREIDATIYEHRANTKSCLRQENCERCVDFCPLNLIYR